MARKTFDDWKALVEKQIASGLSVPQFCNQHNLNPKYFYTRKSKVINATEHAGFIQAQVVRESNTLLASKAEQRIKLKTATGELSLPRDISAQFIVELLNGLTS